MSKRILILDCGPGVAQAIAKAHTLGYYVVTISEQDTTPTPGGDEVRFGELWVHDAIGQVLDECRIDGILQPFGYASFPVTVAASKLKMRALTQFAAVEMQVRHTGATVMEKRGAPVITLRFAETPVQAQEAACEFGLPVWIDADETYSQAPIIRVDEIEDLSLAFSRATRQSLLKNAVVMPVVQGNTFYVDGVMIDGTFYFSGLIGVDAGEPPFRFERGIAAPPPVSGHERDQMVRVTKQALAALDCIDGCVHAEVILTHQGPVVLGMFGAPAALRFPADILLLAHGVDTIANALRFAVGESLRMETTRDRGAAISWIPTHSGVVTEIRGIEEARGVPGVEEIVIVAKPGDVMGHVVDCETRNRVGYVLATGENAQDATRAAKRARDLCEIVTRPAYT